LPALLTVSACLPHAGNDASLTPQVALEPNPTRLTVKAGPNANIAAFAMVREMDGWTLVPLPPVAAQTDSATSARILTFDTEVPVRSRTTIGHARYASVAFSAPSNRDDCAIGPPDQYAPGGHATSYGVAQTSMYYDWGCSQFLATSNPFPAPSAPLTATPGRTGVRWVVVVSSTVARTPAEWSALADSLGTVTRLAAVPGRLGRMAFGAVPDARWTVKVAELARLVPYRP
jgi:hypothetical protein